MAQYQVGSQVFEIPDNTPPDQLDEILRELAKQSQPTQAAQPTGPDTSFGSAFMQGIDQPLENIGTTLQATGLAPEFGQTLKDAIQAPQNYESAANRFINPQVGDRVLNIPGLGEYGIEYLPRAAVEQAGQFAGSLVTRGAGAAAGGAVAGPGGAVAGALAGPALFEFAQQLGPVAIERAKNDGREEPNWDDWTYAAGTAGVSGLLNALGVSGGKGAGFLNKTLREGVTEGTQSAVEQTGTTIDTEKGLTVSAKQAVGEGIIGGTTAGGFDATARIFTGSDSGPADPEAATELANRLKKIADEGGPEGQPEFNLNDVDRMSQTGARAVVEAAHKDIQTEIKQAVKDLRERLQVQDNDDLDTVLRKVQAQAAVEMARNKTKSVITSANFDAVKELSGDTAEGQRLLSLIRQSNELTAVHNDGYQGGVSRITDQFSPLGSKTGYDRGFATLESIVRPIASIGAATANPLIPAAQVGAVGLGRGIDALTGRRSRVRRYIEQNAGQGGIPQQTLPSLRQASIDQQEQEQQAAEAQLAADAARQAETEQINLELARRNAPPVPNSPQGTMEEATGLDRAGVAAALRVLKQTRLGRQLANTIKQYEDSVKIGGRVDNLSALIRAVNDIADTPSALDVARVRPRNMNTQQNQLQLDAQREQGKRDNQAFNDELMRGLKADKTVDAQSKAVGEAALTKLRLDLGRNPLQTASAIVADAQTRAKNPRAIETYVQPYLERVQRQQQVDDASATPEMEQMFEAEGPNDPMRVSTRTPTAVAAFENPLNEDLQVNTDAIRAAPGNLLKKMMKTLNKYDGAKGFRRENKGVPAEQQFKNFLKSNLLHLYNSVSPEYRDRARQWYVGANKLSQAVADQYGLSLPQVSGVMAALSPQQDWYMNYDIGVRVIDTFANAQNEVFSPEMEAAMQRFMDNPANARQRPVHQAMLEVIRGKPLSELTPREAAYFVRFYDEVNNPNGAKYRIISPEGELLDFSTRKDGEPASIRMNGFGNIEKAIRMIQDGSRESISFNLGDRHKVRSFYNNILNPMSDRGDVTIDTHAVAAALLQPLAGGDFEVSHNLGTSGDTSSITGVKGSYGIFADAYREAAAEAGVLPREMQSITWEAIRGLYTGFKTPKNKKTIKNIWKNYDKGTISLEEARGEIYDKAGGINPAAWEDRTEPFGKPDDVGRRDTAVEQNLVPSQSVQLSGNNIPGSGDGQSGRRSAGQSAGVLSLPAEAGQLRTDASLTGALTSILGADNYAPGSIISGSRPATPTEVEQQLEVTERLLADGLPIEIGKAGTAFENGVRSLEAIKRMAEAMNVAFVLAKNMAEMKRLGGGTGVTRGVYGAPNFPLAMADFKTEAPASKIAVLKPGAALPAKSGKGKMGLADATMVAAHELGHHISRVRSDPNVEPRENRQRNYLTGQSEPRAKGPRYDNSFDGEVQKLVNKAFGKNPEAAREIIDELVELQRKGVVSILDQDGGSVMVRDAYVSMFDQLAMQMEKAGLSETEAAQILGQTPQKRAYLRNFIGKQEAYQQSAVELAADMIAVYMVDPQFMKQQAPKTARFVRAYLNSVDSSKVVQFFSAPFAAIVAAIMANMLVGEMEEEDKEQRRGILSA